MYYLFGRERCSVLLQKHFRITPVEWKNFNIFGFVQLVIFLNRFGVSILGTVQQRLILKSSKLLKEFLQTSVGKYLKIDLGRKLSQN